MLLKFAQNFLKNAPKLVCQSFFIDKGWGHHQYPWNCGREIKVVGLGPVAGGYKLASRKSNSLAARKILRVPRDLLFLISLGKESYAFGQSEVRPFSRRESSPSNSLDTYSGIMRSVTMNWMGKVMHDIQEVFPNFPIQTLTSSNLVFYRSIKSNLGLEGTFDKEIMKGDDALFPWLEEDVCGLIMDFSELHVFQNCQVFLCARAVDSSSLALYTTALPMSKEESGKWQALFWKLVGLACEPFTAAGAVLRNDPDKQASSVRLFKGIRGSCFMDLGIGVIMCFLLGLTGMGQYECIEHMHRRHHAIDKGEWVRYIAYLVYFLLGMTAMYLYRAKKTQACAGRIWLFMAFLCFYIMFWSMVVIVIGFDSIATLEACNKQTSLIFASSFSLFT
eukprot:g48202.t1